VGKTGKLRTGKNPGGRPAKNARVPRDIGRVYKRVTWYDNGDVVVTDIGEALIPGPHYDDDIVKGVWAISDAEESEMREALRAGKLPKKGAPDFREQMMGTPKASRTARIYKHDPETGETYLQEVE
jgi:hypothetical protein